MVLTTVVLMTGYSVVCCEINRPHLALLQQEPTLQGLQTHSTAAPSIITTTLRTIPEEIEHITEHHRWNQHNVNKVASFLEDT